MKIPFMDLHRQYLTIKGEMDRAIQGVIDRSEYIGGSEKNLFEKNFANACGVRNCIGVANGTDAITISLKAMGIGAGDEVIVPANSFIASSEAVSMTGAKPVFVDIDPSSYLLSLEKLEDLLSRRAHNRGGKVRAIIPVHLYGRICPMSSILELAKKYDLKVLEDSAQAHLAEWVDGATGKVGRAGSFGHMATFSFYPGKNLGAFGDAGAIMTNDDRLAELARKLANHGRVSKYDHDMEGYNSRLDGMQAAVLNVKLPHLARWSESRRQLARKYNQLLSDLEAKIDLPYVPEGKEHVWHLYVVRLKENKTTKAGELREKIQSKLNDLGVQTVVHYPIALPNLKAYAHLGHKPSDFPISSDYESKIFSLPLFPEMTSAEQEYVSQCLHEIL